MIERLAHAFNGSKSVSHVQGSPVFGANEPAKRQMQRSRSAGDHSQLLDSASYQNARDNDPGSKLTFFSTSILCR